MPTEYTIEGKVSFDQLEAWVKRHEEAEAAGQPLPEPDGVSGLLASACMIETGPHPLSSKERAKPLPLQASWQQNCDWLHQRQGAEPAPTAAAMACGRLARANRASS